MNLIVDIGHHPWNAYYVHGNLDGFSIDPGCQYQEMRFHKHNLKLRVN